MRHFFYVTGNIFCGECGAFLIAEMHRLSNDGFSGNVTVRGHKPECPFHGTAALVKLPQIEAIKIMSDVEADKEWARRQPHKAQ